MSNTAIYREVAEKRKILREQYGGMMSLENVKVELGYTHIRNKVVYTLQTSKGM